MSLHRMLLVTAIIAMFIGLAIAAEPLYESSECVQFNYEDSVSGDGNFASNNKIVAHGLHSDARVYSRLAEVSLQKKDHGSGSIERESIILSNESTNGQTDPDLIYAFGLVATLDNHSMVYAPQTIYVGNGYYATHPMNFNSLVGDKTQIKNYASKTSMGHEINYAHGINMDLVASVEDDYSGWDPSKGLARTLMELDGGITDGTANLRMLQGGPRMSKSAWSKPDIDVDQVYKGTFDFTTKMNLTWPVIENMSEDEWMPCCSDGWVDLINSDKDKKGFGADAKGIFDCTCQKVPRGN